MQDAVMEKEELMKAVNSLARANNVLQMEQREYMMLLKQEQSRSAALMEKLEGKRGTDKGESGMSLVDEVDQLAQILHQQRQEEEQEEGDSLGDELGAAEEATPPPPPIRTRDVGVQCVYIPVELMEDEEEAEETGEEKEVAVEEAPEVVEEVEEVKELEEKALPVDDLEGEDPLQPLADTQEGCGHEEELESLRTCRTELEQQVETMKKDKRVFVTTIKKLDSDCKHISEELQQSKAKVQALELKISDDKAMEIGVLEKVLEIRERLSYVQKTINSKKMKSVLQVCYVSPRFFITLVWPSDCGALSIRRVGSNLHAG